MPPIEEADPADVLGHEEPPVEETAAPTGAPSRHQIIQDAANMGVLARQAISTQFETMAVSPQICANVAALVAELTSTQDEDPAPEDTASASERIDHAREEGRRQAVEAFAQEKADLLTRVSELEASCENLNGRLTAAVAERDALSPPLTADGQGSPVVADTPGQQTGTDPAPMRGPGQS